MAEYEESTGCPAFVDYMTGRMKELERKRFERHMTSCAKCREDAAEWNRVWLRLSEGAPLLEPPLESRNEVFDAIFGKSAPAPPPASGMATAHNASRRAVGPMRLLLLAIALTTAFWAGFLVKSFLSEQSVIANIANIANMPVDPGTPSRIERLIRLAPTADDVALKLGDQAYGITCLLRLQNEQRLVVYVFGTTRTQPNEAYHVWLLRDGDTYNAGSFTVDASGIGVLTLPWPEHAPSFEHVGITLETNADAAVPEGPKIFGSV